MVGEMGATDTRQRRRRTEGFKPHYEDQSALDQYLGDVSRHELITPKEEIELGHRARAGDEEAIMALARANLRFVISVAKKYQNRGVSLIEVAIILIILAMILGLLWGLSAPRIPGGSAFTLDYIKPFGQIFIRLLQMIAVPLVFSSLIIGIAKLKDMSKLTRIGGRTLLFFICTAFIATTIGITLFILIWKIT
jgi:hypothetical protein